MPFVNIFENRPCITASHCILTIPFHHMYVACWLVLLYCVKEDINWTHSFNIFKPHLSNTFKQLRHCSHFSISEHRIRLFQLSRCGIVIIRDKFQWNFNQNFLKQFFLHGNTIKNIVCKMAAILQNRSHLVLASVCLLVYQLTTWSWVIACYNAQCRLMASPLLTTIWQQKIILPDFHRK